MNIFKNEWVPSKEQSRDCHAVDQRAEVGARNCQGPNTSIAPNFANTLLFIDAFTARYGASRTKKSLHCTGDSSYDLHIQSALDGLANGTVYNTYLALTFVYMTVYLPTSFILIITIDTCKFEGDEFSEKTSRRQAADWANPKREAERSPNLAPGTKRYDVWLPTERGCRGRGRA